MNPYYSFNKRESVLLLISFLVLILLMLAAGWIIGTMARSESARKNTVVRGKPAAAPSQMGNIPGVAEVKQAGASLNSAQKDAAALIPASGLSPASAVKPEEKSVNEDQTTAVDKNQSPPDFFQQKDDASQAAADTQKKDSMAEPAADAQEKGKADSADARFCVIADTFVVKSKALKRVSELREKGYAQSLVLRFPAYDKDSNMMNYLIQIGSYESHAEAELAASQFQEKEKSLAVVRSISLSDLKEKIMKTENREGKE